MNYIPLIKVKIDELNKQASDLTFGQLLYSFLRKGVLENNTKEGQLSWLLTIEDKEIYTALEKALKIELDYKKG